jgi:isochorismate synthase
MAQKEFCFEDLKIHYLKKLPFVVYSKPNESRVYARLQKNNTLFEVKDYTESGFIFAPFDASRATVIIPADNSDFFLIDDLTYFEKDLSSEPFKNQNSLDKDFYVDLVNSSIKGIVQGDFEKVVLSRIEKVQLKQTDALFIFKKLYSSYPEAFSYCWYHPFVGLWLGATPEHLLKIRGNTLSTEAIAGTQEYKGKSDIIWGQKEKDEQQMVTNFIVSNLKPFVSDLTISKTETLKAGSLLHLHTSISGHFEPSHFNLKQLLKALHPTPATCGLPKHEARNFILQNENYDRSYYTGFLGELNIKEKMNIDSKPKKNYHDGPAVLNNKTDLFVNLRCMQLQNNEALIYVGGGVTKDSIAELEWKETVNKTRTIKKVLN